MLRILDINGRLIQTNQVGEDESSITIQTCGFAKGIYFVQLRDENIIENQKLIVE